MKRSILMAIFVFVMALAPTAHSAGAAWFIGYWDGFVALAPNQGENGGRTIKMSITEQDDGSFVIWQILPWDAPCDPERPNAGTENWRAYGTGDLVQGAIETTDLRWVCGSVPTKPIQTIFEADTRNGVIRAISNSEVWYLFHRANSPRVTSGR